MMSLSLGRGLVVAGLIASLGGTAFGQTQGFVKPGDEGTVAFPMENDSTSGLDAFGVQLAVRVEPASLADRIQINGVTVQEGGNLPTNIAKAQTRTAIVSYTITNAARDGDSFQVFLDVEIPDQVVVQDPATWNTSVKFRNYSGLLMTRARKFPLDSLPTSMLFLGSCQSFFAFKAASSPSRTSSKSAA